MEFTTLYFATFCAGLAVVSSQQTAVPPNCVCTTQPPMTQMTSNTQNGRWGNKGMHQICGSDGRNYTSKCDFVNAQANNPALGTRPCRTDMRNQTMNGMGGGRWNNGQMGTNQMGSGQMNPGQMGSNQMGPGQMGSSQMGSGQMGSGQMGQVGQMGQMGGRGGGSMSACMTDGTTQTGGRRTMNQMMMQNPSLGVRCRQACPCPALQCPSGRGGHGRMHS